MTDEDADDLEKAMKAIGENFQGTLFLFFVYSHDNYIPMRRGFLKHLAEAE